MGVAAVTGAWSYLGRHITQALQARGQTVRSLTSRAIPADDPFQGAVQAYPLHGEQESLVHALDGVDTLYNTYWVRHTRPPIGHRGPWTTHEAAVARSRHLIDAAQAAGVKRLVHVSITQPDAASPFPYFRGKAAVEAYIRHSGLSYAILRPACFFGAHDILINNIAYAVRRFPLFCLPRPLGYRVRPIHVQDMATLMCTYGADTTNGVWDACGPEQYPFDQLVQQMGQWLTGRRPRLVPLPSALCHILYRIAGQVLRDTILSREELQALAADHLSSTAPPLGTTRLSTWVQAHREDLGLTFRPEPPR